MARQRISRPLGIAALALASLVGCALVLAAYASVRLTFAPLPRGERVIDGGAPFETDAELGFVPLRNGESVIEILASRRRFTVYTDARRLRVEARGAQTPPAVDLLTLGCSFAWGHGVDGAETFTARLGHERGLRVANAAMAGYGTVQALGMLGREKELRPRVVLYAFIEDHLRRNLSPCAPSYAPFCRPVGWVRFDTAGRPALAPPPFELANPAGAQAWQRDVAEHAGFAPSHLLWRIWRDGRQVWNVLAPIQRDDPAAREAAARVLLAAMAEQTDAMGARLVVAAIPELTPGAARPAPALLTRALPRQALLVDLYPAVAAYERAGNAPALTDPDDPHPSAAAHELFARALAEALDANGLLSEASTH
jgi:hypothetical protein